MPTRPNAESRLISALINIGDADGAARYGVSPEMFRTHRSEYEWLLSFPRSFGIQPSAESLKTKFPSFPYSDSYTDVSFICVDVKRRYFHTDMVLRIDRAAEALRNDDVEEAYDHLRGLSHPDTLIAASPVNVIADESLLSSIEHSSSIMDMPWPTLQEYTSGPAKGSFWTFAARLKQGKSWMLAYIIAHALLQGVSIMYFTLEMPQAQVLPRVHAILARYLRYPTRYYDLHGKGFDPIAYRRLLRLIRDDVPGELYVRDTSQGPISTLDVQALSRHADLSIIDHLGLMTSPGAKRAIDDWRVMATISNIIKEIAVSNDVPIIAAAQINREGDAADSRNWKPPKARNLAQADAIGQDSDVIVTMKRRTRSVMVCSLEENRSGESSILWHTRFDPNEGRFDEIDPDLAEDLMERDRERDDL